MASSRPALATTVGRPRRSAAASSTSSWTSVAECTSSTAAAARSTPVSSRRRVPGGEEDEQRAQPLAAGGDRLAGVLGEQRAVAGGQLGEPALQRRHQLGDVPAPGGDHGGDGLGGRHHATSPTWIAMIPPAVTIQRTERRPQRSMVAASARPSGEALHRAGQVGVGVGVGSQAPEQRHHPVEPQREEPRQRRALRRRDLEDHDPPAGAHDARHLGDPALEVGEVARAEADGGGVEARRRDTGARARWPTPSARAGPCARASASISSEKSEPTTSPSGPDPAGQLDRQVAGAGGDVERPGARARRRRGRPRARASGGPGPRSSPRSSGRSSPRCDRTSRAPGSPPACRSVRRRRERRSSWSAPLLQHARGSRRGC